MFLSLKRFFPASAGKSVLACIQAALPFAGIDSSNSASVINYIKNSLQDGEVLAYFYCDFRNERLTSTAEVMHSLLSQLLQKFSLHAVDPVDLIESLIAERDGGIVTINNAILLARYVSCAPKQFNQQPLLVIDALDECADVEGLLEVLKELQKDSIRAFVTSRPLQVIKDSFSGLPLIDMDMMKYEISADIELHVRRELDSHRRLRIVGANLKNEMCFVLCEKADGM